MRLTSRAWHLDVAGARYGCPRNHTPISEPKLGKGEFQFGIILYGANLRNGHVTEAQPATLRKLPTGGTATPVALRFALETDREAILADRSTVLETMPALPYGLPMPADVTLSGSVSGLSINPASYSSIFIFADCRNFWVNPCAFHHNSFGGYRLDV